MAKIYIETLNTIWPRLKLYGLEYEIQTLKVQRKKLYHNLFRKIKQIQFTKLQLCLKRMKYYYLKLRSKNAY